MTTTTVDFFINPTAGRGRAGKRLPRIQELFKAQGIELVVHESSAAGDLETQVKRACAKGCPRVVVAGGDGSVHEAVNGIMAGAGDAVLSVIPSGTGNDFAKACGLPLDWQLAATELATRIAAGQPCRRVDLGLINERYFANGAGIGFDAKVTAIARSYRWPIGDLVYLLAIFRGMADGIATPEFEIVANGQTRRGPVTLANIANGPWIGGMFHIAPMASNDDGAFDLVVADPVTRLQVLGLLPKLMRGKHMGASIISHSAVTEVTIISAQPVPSHFDGEVQADQSRFDVRMLAGALRLL
jgi:YegS/Rv2252/BmrU family lipid kinase